jgi:uncharacterized protein YecT (DUF1311 family)
MGKAGGIIGIVAGVFGVIAAIITLFVGGLGSAFKANGASTVIGLGWGGIAFSFLVIVFGAVAFSRPKGAGIGLIVSSIAGAILGGTLVAVVMALALLGGILAVVGAKPVPQTEGAGSPAAASAPAAHKSRILLWGSGVAVLLLLVAIVFVPGEAKKDEDPLATLANAPTADLAPVGELAEVFNLGSRHTDVQRENKLKEIKGKVVSWRLPVYEVRKRKDGYEIQTKSGMNLFSFLPGNVVGTYIEIAPRNEDEKKQIESLKTGDVVAVRAVIADTTGRRLVLRPAILENAAPAQRATAPAETAPRTQPVAAPLAAKAPEVVSVDHATTIKGRFATVSISDPPRRLQINGEAISDSKGELIEHDLINFVRYAQLPEVDVIVFHANCRGSACGEIGLYRILVLDGRGNRALSAKFGDRTTEPTVKVESNAVVLDFGSKGTATFRDGAIGIASALIPQSPPTASPQPANSATAQSAAPLSPSFDCAKAGTAAEQLICANRELAEADLKLAQLYRQSLASTADKESFRRTQNEWRLRQRDACAEANCMLRAYQARIQQLGG